MATAQLLQQLLLLLLADVSRGAEIVVFGDSWGVKGADAFARMFSKRGISASPGCRSQRSKHGLMGCAALASTAALGWRRPTAHELSHAQAASCHLHPGVSIANAAVSGLTAKQVAEKDPAALQRVLGEDTRHVWLTIGGNDAQYELPGCGARCVPQVVNQTLEATRAFVAPALAAFPKVRGKRERERESAHVSSSREQPT